jgi:hypothetical protein
MFGSKKKEETEGWRIRVSHNEKLYDLYLLPDIIRGDKIKKI